MKVGYIHAGRPEHGVRRFGELLAGAASQRPGIETAEVRLEFDADARGNRRRAIDAAEAVQSCDVVHIQYNPQSSGSVWGARSAQLRNLHTFLSRCTPPVVTTLHDVHATETVRTVLARLTRSRGGWRVPAAEGNAVSRGARPPRTVSVVKKVFGLNSAVREIAIRYVGNRAGIIVVCSQEERRSLSAYLADTAVEVVPHFVESRHRLPDSKEAKAGLGLSGRRVVTLLGYIHARKGWRMLLEAVATLPDDVFVLLAGSVSSGEEGRREVERAADALRLTNRVRVTGYIPEEQLNTYLAATDLAVTPFTKAAASGSISTWISARRPILASAIPLIEEYNRVVSGAIETFEPYTAEALATAIRERLDANPDPGLGRLERLREELSMERSLDRHLALYEAIADLPDV